MEHPDKALFDEVRGLRNTIEESKERIIQIEAEYLEKVEYLEKRGVIAERCDKKISEYLNNIKSKITFLVNGKEYTFFRSTFEQNIYKSTLDLSQGTIEMDIDKKHFKALLHIILLGNGQFSLDEELKYKNKKFQIPKNVQGNLVFAKSLTQYFDNESYLLILTDFGISINHIPNIKPEELIIDCQVENNVKTINEQYVATEPSDISTLGGPNSQKSYFLNFNGKLNITLSQTIRTDRLIIKPFHADNNVFAVTSGNTYTSVFASLDGAKWKLLCNIPANYGAGTNNYLCELFFTITSFKYLRFQAASNYLFSLSYLGFTKNKNEKLK